jgi:hypothetical protein
VAAVIRIRLEAREMRHFRHFTAILSLGSYVTKNKPSAVIGNQNANPGGQTPGVTRTDGAIFEMPALRAVALLKNESPKKTLTTNAL